MHENRNRIKRAYVRRKKRWLSMSRVVLKKLLTGPPEMRNVKPMHSYIMYSLVKRRKRQPITPFPHECLYKLSRIVTPGNAEENEMKRKRSILCAPLDQLGGCWLCWIQKVAHHCAKSFEINRLRNIVAETRFDALVKNISHNICG